MTKLCLPRNNNTLSPQTELCLPRYTRINLTINLRK